MNQVNSDIVLEVSNTIRLEEVPTTPEVEVNQVKVARRIGRPTAEKSRVIWLEREQSNSSEASERNPPARQSERIQNKKSGKM